MGFQVKCGNCAMRVDADPMMVGQKIVCPDCGGQFLVPMTSITSGLVDNDFWIQKSLGTGNISEMFLAKRLSNDERIILKALTPAVTIDPAATNAYTAQLQQASGAIDHPYFSNVVEVSEMAGHTVCVLPYVDGECLDRSVTPEKPMPERDALKIIHKISRYMRIGWDQSQLVHGSIRPGNILIDGEGDPHILEAGNFKRVLAGNTLTLDHLNKAGTVADYMSPEEAQGAQLDCRSDIYSLGATLFFMLTGTRPYDGNNTTDILHSHLNAPVPDAQERNPDVSDAAADLIADMMAKNPDERFQNWRELAGEIKGMLRAGKTGTETELALDTQPDTDPAQDDAAPEKKGINLLLLAAVGIAAALLLGLVVIGAIVAGSGNKSKREQQQLAQQEQARRSPKVEAIPASSVLGKKIDAILKYYSKDKAERGPFAIERLQKLAATDAKTDAERRSIQARIATIKTEMTTAKARPIKKELPKKQPEDKKPQQQPREIGGPGPIKAAKVANPSVVMTRGYLDFLVIGPFPNQKMNRTIKSIWPDAPTALPDFNEKVSKLTWQRPHKPNECGLFDLFPRTGNAPQDNVHFYAVATVIAEEDTQATMHFWHDDQLTAWLDHKEIHSAQNGSDKSEPIELKKGRHTLIVRAANKTGQLRFELLLTDRNSKPLPATVKMECPSPVGGLVARPDPPETLRAFPHVLKSGYVDFLTIGPLLEKVRDEAWEEIRPATPKGLPDFNAMVRNKRWQRLYKASDKGLFNISAKVPGRNLSNTHFYAAATITAEADTPARFHFSHDDYMTIWLNGEKLYDSMKTSYNLALDVKLKEGRNALILRPGNGRFEFRFGFAITRRDKAVLPAGVTIQCPDPKQAETAGLPPVIDGSPQALKQGYMDFALVGPVPNKIMEMPWRNKVRPAQVRGLPNFNDRVNHKSWQRPHKPGDRGRVDFSKMAGKTVNDVHFYAVATVTAKAETPARFHFDHDDGLTVWLNRGVVYEANEVTRAKAVDVTLPKGKSTVILRCSNNHSGFYFNFAVTRRDKPVLPDGVTIECPLPGKKEPEDEGLSKLEIASPEILAQRNFVDFRSLGPFPTTDQDEIWKAIKPKAEMGLPDFKAKVKGLSWKRLYKAGDKGSVNFSDKAGVGNQGGIHFYAVATIAAPSDMPAKLHFDHYDAMNLWLNGTEVYRLNRSAYTRSRTVNLKKGKNVVIIRLANQRGRFAFRFAMSNLRHEPLPDTVKLGFPGQ